MKNSIRGEVIARWEKAGKPMWDIHKTMEIVRSVDDEFKKLNLMPARAYREKRDTQYYAMHWVYGLKFPWIYDSTNTSTQFSPNPNSSFNQISMYWRACLKCGIIQESDGKFCKHCGSPMPGL